MKVLQSLSTESDIWRDCLAQLSREIPATQFNTWISPLKAAWTAEQGTLTIFFANRFKLEAVKSQFSKKIQKVIQQVLGQDAKLRFSMQNQASAMQTLSPRVESANAANHPQDNPRTLALKALNSPTVRITTMPASSGLARVSELVEKLPHQNANPTSPRSVALPLSAHAPTPSSHSSQNFENSSNTAHLNKATAPAAQIRVARGANPNKLRDEYTFETFVVGKSNLIAVTYAQYVADSPGNRNNPLFIYGPIGVGKSHLMHAIGHSVLNKKRDARILYTTSSGFVTDVVGSYRDKTFDKIKDRYHDLDLLLIDDVQFFSGKDRSQEEFFHTFEALINRQSHIVLTSDTYPRMLSGIHSRLVSRLDAGLSLTIDPPEFEMRIEILTRKAAAEKINLPMEIAEFIANHIKSSGRALEGALCNVIAGFRLQNSETVITIPIVKHALRDLLGSKNGHLTIETIQKAVADYYRLTVADMHSKKRPASIAKPRQIAMYLCKELTKHSLPEIGAQFGGRDHTTVLHAVRKIAEERNLLGSLKNDLIYLEQVLNN